MKKFVCRYAGDMEDEYCGVCDGIMAAMADGKSVPATECPGFEPGDVEVSEEEPVEEAELDVANPKTPVEEPADKVPFEEDDKVESVPKQETKPAKEPVKETTKKEEVKTKKETKQEVKKEVKSDDKCCCTCESEITEIRVDSGVSFEATPGNWYKVSYGETRKVSGTEDEVEAVRKAMWDKANSEVDNQVADILENLKTTK